MAKVKTLKKTAILSLKIKKNSGVIEYSPTEKLLDEDLIGRAIWECLKNNDPEGVIEVINAHLRAVNKAQSSKKSALARSTMYHSLKSKNPTIATLAKLINTFI